MYNGCTMSNSSSVIPGAKSLASIPVVLSKPARQRLKWFDYYRFHGNNARRTCRYFGISPQIFYRWKRRYNPYHLDSLEDRAHRPKRLRQPTAAPELVVAVLKLREKYPRWGKDKLVVLLREEGYLVSNSMVGRTIRRLKDRGVLHEPIKNHVSAHRRGIRRPYAVRKPKGYEIFQPGDLVQLDTMDIRPLPGVVLKHFTARDVISRWDTIDVCSRATAGTAAEFLNKLEQRMPNSEMFNLYISALKIKSFYSPFCAVIEPSAR